MSVLKFELWEAKRMIREFPELELSFANQENSWYLNKHTLDYVRITKSINKSKKNWYLTSNKHALIVKITKNNKIKKEILNEYIEWNNYLIKVEKKEIARWIL